VQVAGRNPRPRPGTTRRVGAAPECGLSLGQTFLYGTCVSISLHFVREGGGHRRLAGNPFLHRGQQALALIIHTLHWTFWQGKLFKYLVLLRFNKYQARMTRITRMALWGLIFEEPTISEKSPGSRDGQHRKSAKWRMQIEK